MEIGVMLVPNLTVGLDLGDKRSCVCEVDAAGRVVRQGSIPTTKVGLEEFFGDRSPVRVALEVGTHSPWVSRQLTQLGHEVIVGNPAAMYGKRRRKKRNDSMDAEFLARQGRADPELLHPITHRGSEVQTHLSLLRSRDLVVRMRSQSINQVRGLVKSLGGRIRPCSAEAFARQARQQIPAELELALTPVLATVEFLSKTIREYDRQIEKLIEEHYPEARRLQQISGVGPVTSLAFVLLIEDPRRFSSSREVGAYFGLVPRLDESSDSQPQLRITKSGDPLGRRLLVSAAHYIMARGPECDLRRHGEQIASRGGKNAKKRAVVAVARKLSVLMHRLWVSTATYEPTRSGKPRVA